MLTFVENVDIDPENNTKQRDGHPGTLYDSLHAI